MSGHHPRSISPPHSTSQHTEQISPDTFQRCAELLAAGEMDWPEGLSKEQQSDLLTAVRRCRRARLIKFIASRIAADLAAEARSRAREAQL
jgi:hypothetical protein